MFELHTWTTRMEARGDAQRWKHTDISHKSCTVLSQSTPGYFIDLTIKWPSRQLAVFVALLLNLNLVPTINSCDTDCWWRKQKKKNKNISLCVCFANTTIDNSRHRPGFVSLHTAKAAKCLARPQQSSQWERERVAEQRDTLGLTLHVEKVIHEESLQMEKKKNK